MQLLPYLVLSSSSHKIKALCPLLIIPKPDEVEPTKAQVTTMLDKKKEVAKLYLWTTSTELIAEPTC